MAEHNDLGKSGENAAVAYLEQKGYLCLLYTSDAADE